MLLKKINLNLGMGSLHKLSRLCRHRAGKDISVPDPSQSQEEPPQPHVSTHGHTQEHVLILRCTSAIKHVQPAVGSKW